MPEMDGMETIEYFQGNKDMKIIVISGGSPDGIDLLSAARELGASRIKSKPIELEENWWPQSKKCCLKPGRPA